MLSTPVEVPELAVINSMPLFDMHYAEGDSMHILAANPDDYTKERNLRQRCC